MTDSAPLRAPDRRPLLEVWQRLETSGARAVEPFVHGGEQYLAVAQLAQDIPGRPAQMNGGDSNVDALVYRWTGDRFVEHQRLPAPGGEDVEFFRIGERAFLATASLRTGAGPYDVNAESVLFEFRDGRFEPFQRFPTFAAKQWKHFLIGARHFLALAQGVVMDGLVARHPSASCLLAWDGQRFAPFQDVPSAWGYNWAYVEIDGHQLLAYADHVEPSRILRWNGHAFEDFQILDGRTGRAACFFVADGEQWLAFANLHDDSILYRWDGARFVRKQRLSGPGGREFEWFSIGGTGYLVQVNFLLGSREAPQTALQSTIYRFGDQPLTPACELPTFGGTDAAAFTVGAATYLAVANSLTADVRFRTDTIVYKVTP